jgi:menaquinol-cytochrome c reductase cytochrome b/c subunit
MSSLDEARARHKRYKENVEKRGKPFYPFAMFHDTVMSLVVVSVIVALACIWYFTAGETAGDDGLLGPRYTDKADPGTISFVPRPDWYFYFLFYLLRIFKWPETVVLGTVGIPTLLLVVLLLIPFFDRSTERRLTRRPVVIVTTIVAVISMGVLTYKGATAKEALGSESLELVDTWVARNHLPPDARRGAEIFAQVGCMQCHTYLGAGSSNLGAPDLSAIGSSGQDASFFQRYVANPREFGNNIMPVYENLGEENLRSLGIFLEASKGE